MMDQVFSKMNGLSLRLDVSNGANGSNSTLRRSGGVNSSQTRRRVNKGTPNEIRLKNGQTHVRLDLSNSSTSASEDSVLTRLRSAANASSPWSLEITRANAETMRVLAGDTSGLGGVSFGVPRSNNSKSQFKFGSSDDSLSPFGFGKPSNVVPSQLNALSNLTSLSLRSGRGVGDEGAVQLARALRGAVPSLKSLDVSGNDLGKKAAQALGEALFWSESDETENQLFSGVSPNTNGPKGCALEVLDISGNHVGSDGACALADALVRGGCPKLKKLDVSQNLIGAAGVAAIAEVLVAQATRRSHHSRQFKQHALQELSLRHNGCSDAGVVAIATAMRKSAEISVGRMRGGVTTTTSEIENGFSFETSASPRSKTVHSFQTLKLGFNGVGPLGAMALADAINVVRHAARGVSSGGDSSTGDAMDDGNGDRTQRSVVIAELDLACNAIGPDGTRSIAAALDDGVETLHLGNNAIGDVGVKELAKALVTNSTTTSLNISGNEITETGAWWLAEFFSKGNVSRLQNLDLGANAVGDAGACDLAEELPECHSLVHVDLRRNGITKKGAESFCEAIARVDELRNWDERRSDSKSASSLVALSLRGNAIDAASQSAIRNKFGLRIDVEMQANTV